MTIPLFALIIAAIVIFLAGGTLGVLIMCMMIAAARADERWVIGSALDEARSELRRVEALLCDPCRAKVNLGRLQREQNRQHGNLEPDVVEPAAVAMAAAQ